MRKALQAYFTVFLFFVSATATAVPYDEIDLSQMGEEIHLTPWLSYQKLIAMQSSSQSYDETKYLWWLLSKAQAENFINFYDDFENTVQQAAGLITAETPLEIQSRVNLFQGVIHRNHGDYVLAEEAFSNVMIKANQKNLSRIYVQAKKEIASTKALTEYYETSLNGLQEAYVEAFSLKDQYLMASINEAYGAIYGYLQEFEKSVEYYKRALDSYKYLKYPAQIARATGGLASTYRYWKKYDLAIEYFKQYQQDISYIPHSNVNFLSFYGLGMTYAENGDCELAITIIDKALKLDGLTHYFAELYKKKAICLISLNKLDEAEEALFNAANIFSKLPDLMGTAWQLEVIKISGELTHARGNYDLGYKMLKQYYEQYAELLVKNSSKELEKIKKGVASGRFKIMKSLEKKRSEIELLELEKQNTMTAQKLYLKILIFCLLVATFVVMILQHRNNKKISALTIKDPLTDLFNRRYIFDYLDDLLTNSKVDNTELSLVLIDIDDLKIVNDQFGYPVGDEVIRKIAYIGKEIFRQSDVVSRIGGGKLFCALPRTTINEAEKVALRLLNNVNQAKLITGNQYKVTVSIGVTGVCSKYYDLTQLFINAEQAVFDAKHLGKNQVNIFETD